MNTEKRFVDEARQISAQRMEKVLGALAKLNYRDFGKVRHPIGYPGCRKVIRGKKVLFVAPAVEDYRCVTIWDMQNCICIINTVTMKVVANTETGEFVDTNQTLTDVLDK